MDHAFVVPRTRHTVKRIVLPELPYPSIVTLSGGIELSLDGLQFWNIARFARGTSLESVRGLYVPANTRVVLYVRNAGRDEATMTASVAA